jgi:probable rRNA maturation factor
VTEVLFVDEQTDHPVDAQRLGTLARHVLAAEGVGDRAEVAIAAVDEDAIAALHERFLDRVGPTDVLAFPLEDDPRAAVVDPDGPPLLLGDVVLCPAVAQRNAPEHAGTYEAELDLLTVHGLLHLLGWDHESDADAEAMEARERELLASFSAAGAAP